MLLATCSGLTCQVAMVSLPVLIAQSCLFVTPKVLCPWDSSGKNTGVVCHILLQGIFPTQGSNPGILHGRQILYQ